MHAYIHTYIPKLSGGSLSAISSASRANSPSTDLPKGTQAPFQLSEACVDPPNQVLFDLQLSESLRTVLAEDLLPGEPVAKKNYWPSKHGSEGHYSAGHASVHYAICTVRRVLQQNLSKLCSTTSLYSCTTLHQNLSLLGTQAPFQLSAACADPPNQVFVCHRSARADERFETTYSCPSLCGQIWRKTYFPAKPLPVRNGQNSFYTA